MGGFALLAGGALLLLRFAALAEAGSGSAALGALLLAPLAARTAVVAAMAAYPVAESSLLGRSAALPWREALPPVALGALLLVPAALLAGPLGAFGALAALALWSALLAGFLVRRMGGLSGDGYGALVESGETVVLIALALG